MTPMQQPSRSPETQARRTYRTPEVTDLGLVSRLTMGNGGSSLDGNCTFTQRGQGNDGTGPHDNCQV